MIEQELNRPATSDEAAGMAWWNSQTELAREFWLRVAVSARPADAWGAYKFAMTEKEHNDDHDHHRAPGAL